jgi:hypothetical protein|tara:strand:+ start:277 stop:459 length:183 start_codon:yes stop_codon:yes gene_type:complete
MRDIYTQTVIGDLAGLASPTILFTSNPLTREPNPSQDESEQGLDKLISEYWVEEGVEENV